MTHTKTELLQPPLSRVDVRVFDARPIIGVMRHMALQTGNLPRAAAIYEAALREPSWGVPPCQVGSFVDIAFEHMAFGGAMTTMPLLVSAVHHGRTWTDPQPRRFAEACL
jgi:hypothetical protein